MFVSSGPSLLSANVNIKFVSTAGSGDKLIIRNSLKVLSQNARVYSGKKATKDELLRIKNTAGFTIQFSSYHKNRGKGFLLNIVALSKGNYLQQV